MFKLNLYNRIRSEPAPQTKAILPIKEGLSLTSCCNNQVQVRPTLFYDVDGVLHPNDANNLSCANLLVSVIEHIPTLQLVMSSNWRETMDLEYFERVFPKEIIKRTVGFTPVLPVHQFRRQREVETFISYFGITKFLCIDDQEKLFTPGWPSLHLTERSRGLNQQSIKEIINFFNEDY